MKKPHFTDSEIMLELEVEYLNDCLQELTRRVEELESQLSSQINVPKGTWYGDAL